MLLRNSLYAAALAGLAASASAHSDQAKDKGVEKCWGVNKCKAHTKCGVGKSDIDATKEAYGDKFAKSATHDCAGIGECAAAKGQLGWIEVKEGTCIKTEKGFLIVKNGDKKTIRK